MAKRVKITGGRVLHGTIAIGGAKNAALPILAASLLSNKDVNIHNIPDIADTRLMMQILHSCGVTTVTAGECSVATASRNRIVTVNASKVDKFEASHDLVSKMRASVLVLGPLLARFGEARVALPGGCAIGARPIDMHLSAFAKMGAVIEADDCYIAAKAPNGLHGAEINFEKVSVGATENVAMAATLASGTTVINNAAREPEVVDLLNFLCGMGAKITGIGTSRLEITGVAALDAENYHHAVIGDRIETATYAIAAALTGGSLLLSGMDHTLMDDVWAPLSKAGVKLKVIDATSIQASSYKDGPRAMDVATAPYPGFPTDVQAQMMALLTQAKGESHIKETIHDNRFMHVKELNKMGANITTNGDTATVRGVSVMHSAEVMATDLRASAALVLSALSSEEGQSYVINDVYHLERGYDRMFFKLAACGADISIDKGDGFEKIEYNFPSMDKYIRASRKVG